MFLLALSARGVSHAQEQPWWYTFERGKIYFREGAYGDALIAFEDARRSRIAQFTRLEEDLITLLSTQDARRLGDSLDFVERLIAERRETRAAEALNQLYHRVPKESLRGSARAALAALGSLARYPEAEYWLGETYRAEGELALALRQYERAWNEREFLETPGFDIEILYRITEIHRIRRNYQEMETRAVEIIEGNGPQGAPRDTLWAGNSAGNAAGRADAAPVAANSAVSSRNPDLANSAAAASTPRANIRAAMARILENEGIHRFLSLYRHNNTSVEKAHRLLGFFYYASSRYTPAAERLMFAFLIQNSVLIEEIIRRNYDFTFTTLENLMTYVDTRPELTAFIEDTEYYKTAYCLAAALYASRKTRPASQLWAFLASRDEAGEWGNRARRNPTPFLDRAVEMP